MRRRLLSNRGFTNPKTILTAAIGDFLVWDTSTSKEYILDEKDFKKTKNKNNFILEGIVVSRATAMGGYIKVVAPTFMSSNNPKYGASTNESDTSVGTYHPKYGDVVEDGLTDAMSEQNFLKVNTLKKTSNIISRNTSSLSYKSNSINLHYGTYNSSNFDDGETLYADDSINISEQSAMIQPYDNGFGTVYSKLIDEIHKPDGTGINLMTHWDGWGLSKILFNYYGKSNTPDYRPSMLICANYEGGIDYNAGRWYFPTPFELLNVAIHQPTLKHALEVAKQVNTCNKYNVRTDIPDTPLQALTPFNGMTTIFAYYPTDHSIVWQHMSAINSARGNIGATVAMMNKLFLKGEQFSLNTEVGTTPEEIFYKSTDVHIDIVDADTGEKIHGNIFIPILHLKTIDDLDIRIPDLYFSSGMNRIFAIPNDKEKYLWGDVQVTKEMLNNKKVEIPLKPKITIPLSTSEVWIENYTPLSLTAVKDLKSTSTNTNVKNYLCNTNFWLSNVEFVVTSGEKSDSGSSYTKKDGTYTIPTTTSGIEISTSNDDGYLNFSPYIIKIPIDIISNKLSFSSVIEFGKWLSVYKNASLKVKVTHGDLSNVKDGGYTYGDDAFCVIDDKESEISLNDLYYSSSPVKLNGLTYGVNIGLNNGRIFDYSGYSSNGYFYNYNNPSPATNHYIQYTFPTSYGEFTCRNYILYQGSWGIGGKTNMKLPLTMKQIKISTVKAYSDSPYIPYREFIFEDATGDLNPIFSDGKLGILNQRTTTNQINWIIDIDSCVKKNGGTGVSIDYFMHNSLVYEQSTSGGSGGSIETDTTPNTHLILEYLYAYKWPDKVTSVSLITRNGRTINFEVNDNYSIKISYRDLVNEGITTAYDIRIYVYCGDKEHICFIVNSSLLVNMDNGRDNIVCNKYDINDMFPPTNN